MVKKIVLYLFDALCIFIAGFAVLVLLSVVMTKSGDAPNIFGFSFFRVLTGSMEPTIATDSFIITHNVDPGEIREGEIISYYSSDPTLEGNVNTHRVVSVIQDGQRLLFETKGDANPISDSYVVDSVNVIGRVVFTSVLIGKLVRLLVNPLVFIPVILIPLLLVIFFSLKDAIRSTKKIMQEEQEEEIRKVLEQLEQRKQAKAQENTLEAAQEKAQDPVPEESAPTEEQPENQEAECIAE